VSATSTGGSLAVITPLTQRVDLLAIVERQLRDEDLERLARAAVGEQPVASGAFDIRVITAAAAEC
jgi:hypothetical protein